MKLTGENHISAPKETVWEALNDPEILRQSIPGCESLEKVSDTEFKATVVTKIGPIKAKFNGEVELSDLDPPNGYTLSGKGSGGSAGNAKGSAKVRLTENDDGTTLLTYDVDADVSGKLAQLGSRLIDSTAKVLAGKFFKSFQEIVSAPEANDAVSSGTGVERTSTDAATKSVGNGKISRMIFVTIGALVVIALIIIWGLSRTG